MRLYHHPVSSNARRVAMAAIALNAPLELVEVNLMSADDRRRLEQLNPNSKIPVLQDGDFVLWESCAILQYLADKTPGQTLYPSGLQARADVNRWLFWACQHFSPAISMTVWENIWKGMTGNGGPDPVELAKSAALIDEYAPVLDQHLATRAWVCGEALSLADLALAAPLMYLDKAKVPLRQYGHIMAWFARVQELDCWKKTEAAW
ncbi:MAG: glutathione S-transferase family protein [Pseudomonadota bacterium]